MQFRKMMMEVTTKSTINDKGEVKKTIGVDPFDYIAIASEWQAIYRELFLEEEYQTEVTNTWSKQTLKCPTKFEDGKAHVQLPHGKWVTRETVDNLTYRIGNMTFYKSPSALIPNGGYNSDTFSKASIQWLEWIMGKSRRDRQPLKIWYALNGGEHRVPGRRTDWTDMTRCPRQHKNLWVSSQKPLYIGQIINL